MTASNTSIWHPEADPNPFGLAGGTAVMIGATMIAASMFPASQTPARLAVVAVAVGGCAATLADARTSLALAGLGYLLFTGFLINSRGELSWDGIASLWHLVVLAIASGIGLAYRWISAVQADLAFDTALHQLLEGAEQNENAAPT